ncbi:LysE family translocator [Oenococcus sp.]|uniref:LysE family translocator n=1 Tax=Oenococcus sp. TaxID=1979414 RepID=UPI0039EC45B7
MFGFFSYSIIMEITPGPNNLMALQESRQHGFRGSIPFLNGLFVSFFILDFLAFFFTDFLKSISATAVLLMKILGSLYLIHLILDLFRTKSDTHGKQKIVSSNRQFWAGMLLNLTNVKVILYFLIGYISFFNPSVSEQSPSDYYFRYRDVLDHRCLQLALGRRGLSVSEIVPAS